MDGLMPIGRFSLLAGLSIKTLHHYDAIGLLRPAEVDQGSGYRRYRAAQLREATVIRALRDVAMPLDEVAEVVRMWNDPDAVRNHLKRHRERLESDATEAGRRLAFVDQLLEDGGPMPYQIVTKELDPQPVVTLRTVLPTEEIYEVPGRTAELFMQVAEYLYRHGIWERGPSVRISHSLELGETHDASYGFYVSTAVPTTGVFRYHLLDGGRFLSTTHVGPLDQFANAFTAMAEWIAQEGAEETGPWRSICHDDPSTTDPAKLRSEILVPLA